METETQMPLGEGNPFVEIPKAQAEHERVVAAAQTAAPDPYAVSPRWSKAREYKKPFDYFLETSEQKLRLHRLDMGDLLKLGISEEMDFMTKALMTEDKPKDTPKEAVSSVVMKSENFKGMEGMINKVCMEGILKPDIKWPPMKEEKNDKGQILVVDEESKIPGVLYIDDIPFEERMELFSVIFDSAGLSTFRQEQELGVGDVETIPSVPLPSD